MDRFIEWLKGRHRYSKSTLHEKGKHMEQWENLCHESLETISAKSLLRAVAVQKNLCTATTLNFRLKTLEQYYEHLADTGIRKDRPLKGLRIRTGKKPLLTGLLTERELEAIYERFPSKGRGGRFNTYTERNRAMLGLMIYQALGTGSLEKLEIKDLDLEKGTIHIPKTTDNRLNARTLPLEPKQVMELHRYLETTRKGLLKLLRSDSDTKKLFPKGEKTTFAQVAGGITRRLRKTGEAENLLQLRNSRIAIWMKRHNLREVQHRAGYRSLISLEPFRQDGLESLIRDVGKYHPL